MQFLRVDRDKAVRAIAGRICQELKDGKRVLWLVSGGSNISIEVEVLNIVRSFQDDKLEGLAILPTDERFGKVGHRDSNYEQLKAAGFDPGNASWIDVLTHNVSFDQTIDFYGEVASVAFKNAGVIVGQLGMGPDGHIAGIKPESPAVKADEVLVAGYDWSDYKRMTLTPLALRQVKVAFVPAYGEDKLAKLQQLQNSTGTAADFPALLLYDIPEVYVYNDAIESEG